ncbi:MAG: hypothetical protein CML23_26215 [Rhizobiaceae bacterium]|nr:hypothetical protein [Rhizobiaceae bacterium]
MDFSFPAGKYCTEYPNHLFSSIYISIEKSQLKCTVSVKIAENLLQFYMRIDLYVAGIMK